MELGAAVISEAFGLAVVALCVYRTTRLLVKDTLMSRWQTWLVRRWPEEVQLEDESWHPWQPHYDQWIQAVRGTRSPFGCPYCLSVYLTVVFTVAARLVGLLHAPVLMLPFEGWAAAGAVVWMWKVAEGR